VLERRRHRLQALAVRRPAARDDPADPAHAAELYGRRIVTAWSCTTRS
jgi:hypothetical protein